MIGSGHSRAVFAVYPVFLVMAMSGACIIARLLRERDEVQDTDNGRKIRAIIYGAGRLGTETLRLINFESGVEIVGFVDENDDLKGKPCWARECSDRDAILNSSRTGTTSNR